MIFNLGQIYENSQLEKPIQRSETAAFNSSPDELRKYSSNFNDESLLGHVAVSAGDESLPEDLLPPVAPAEVVPAASGGVFGCATNNENIIDASAGVGQQITSLGVDDWTFRYTTAEIVWGVILVLGIFIVNSWILWIVAKSRELRSESVV